MTPHDAVPTNINERSLPANAPRFIELSIRGKDLMLSGKFQHWVPLALQTGGKQSEAQLLIDVTSPGPANDTAELFSFASDRVKRVGEGAYLVKGVLREGDLQCPADAMVLAPAAHSAFASITFQVDEATFPEIWRELSARLAVEHGGDVEVRPRAWLVAPALAAA
jgi:hypothetical protein